MTDDRLHALWLGGHSITAIAHEACVTKSSVASRIRRLRCKDPQAWPHRPNPKQQPNPAASRGYQRKRAGAVTLPPLASLSD